MHDMLDMYCNKTRVSSLLLLATALFARDACAQSLDAQRCDDAQILVVARHLDAPALADKMVASWCKPWPHRAGVSLAAVAYDAGVAERKSLVVVTIDQRKNRVLATYRDSLVDDAVEGEVHEWRLRLDTAAYRLNDKTVAFGLRQNESLNVSCADGRTNQTLTLLVPGTPPPATGGDHGHAA